MIDKFKEYPKKSAINRTREKGVLLNEYTLLRRQPGYIKKLYVRY